MIRQLCKQDFALGRPLPYGVYDRDGKLLLRRGFVLEYDDQLERLLNRGIYQDTDADAREAAKEARTQAASNITVRPAVQENAPVYERIGATTLRLKSLITDLRSSEPSVEVGDRIRALAKNLLEAVREDRDAALAAVHLDFHNLYILSHQVHNAVLCALVGELVKLTGEELHSLMCAALTCDLGMTDLPEFEKQKGPLTDNQKTELRGHPARSVELLKRARITDPLWLEAVANHHERADGSGYPSGTTFAQAPLPVAILAVADVYLALIKPRPWREARIPLTALKDLFAMKESGLCTRGGAACDGLVKELGMYPPGSIVRLNNDEIAVVSKRGADMRKPPVYSLYERNGVPRLSPVARDTSDPNFAVKAALSHAECRSVSLIISRLWTQRNRI